MKKIIIINGPNLNLIGKREPEIYGNQSFDDCFIELQNNLKQNILLEYFQSNIEGELINKIHEVGFGYDGIIINAGAYSHTSVAIADAISSIKTPCIEVHISNVFAREAYRHHSYISPKCKGVISGFGLRSYALAIQYFIDI